MHVTVAEAALAGAAITALGSAIAGLMIQRATSSRDHQARLWEKQAALYEEVLNEVSLVTKKRIEVMAELTDDPIEFISSGELPLQSAYWDKLSLLVRLDMFGSQAVKRAFLFFSGLQEEWYDSLAYMGEHASNDDEEMSDAVSMLKLRADKALSADGILSEVVYDDIQRVRERRRLRLKRI